MQRVNKGIRQYFKENLGIMIGFVVLCIVVSVLNSRFLTGANLLNVARQLFSNANLALGMGLVIISGGIDLSVGAVMALSGTICAGMIAQGQLPMVLAILLGLAIGVLVGTINGFIISKLELAPFIVTMAVQQICRGLVYIYTGGKPIRCIHPVFNFLGNGYLGPFPITIYYTTLFLFLGWLVLSRAQLGRRIYAVGGNPPAARYSGISVSRVRISVYAISGFLAAFAGIIYSARMYSGQPTLGTGDETDAIAAVVLGGTSFNGGIGKIGGILLGVLVIAVLSNALNLLRISSFWQLVAKGGVILLAVTIDRLKKQGKIVAKSA